MASTTLHFQLSTLHSFGALDLATIRVTCDGPSDLGDHVIIARTNQVCHVPLLAGATYAVESNLPLAYSAVSSEHAHIVTNSQNSLVVSFPLEFSFEPMRAVASFRLVSNPVDVNATLLSVVGGCCSCQTNDVGFTWSCDGGCPCGGGVGHMLSSTVAWQGYSSLFTGWHVCPCPPVVIPEGGQGDSSPKLVIDSPRTFFTNSNGGAEDSIETISHTNKTTWLDIRNDDRTQNLVLRREIANLTQNSFGLEVYFIDRIGGNIKANNDEYGIVVSTNWTSDTLAHEIGHSFGCADVYPTHWDNARISLPDNVVRREHAPLDWNNGDGSRYYSPNLTQMKLIERVLMCGYNVGLDRRDMPSGPIYGFNKTNECDNVDTGFFVDGTRRSLFLHR